MPYQQYTLPSPILTPSCKIHSSCSNWICLLHWWDASRVCATMRCVCLDVSRWCTMNDWMCCDGAQQWDVSQSREEDMQCVMFRDAYLLTSDCKLWCLLHLGPYLDQKLSPNRHRINFEEPVPVWGLERPSSSTGRPSSSTGPVTIRDPTYICLAPFCHPSSSGTGRPVPELGAQFRNWDVPKWALCSFLATWQSSNTSVRAEISTVLVWGTVGAQCQNWTGARLGPNIYKFYFYQTSASRESLDFLWSQKCFLCFEPKIFLCMCIVWGMYIYSLCI
jgi:hypothetical protein